MVVFIVLLFEIKCSFTGAYIEKKKKKRKKRKKDNLGSIQIERKDCYMLAKARKPGKSSTLDLFLPDINLFCVFEGSPNPTVNLSVHLNVLIV